MPEKKFGSVPEEGKLFIGGLTYNTTDEMLKDYYSQWGRLVDFIVMKDSDTKRSRGFGFVTYADSAWADLAMDNRPHIIDGKTVEAKRAMPRESDPSQPQIKLVPKVEKSPSVKRLFLSGVKEEHSEQMFLEYFVQFGNVLSVEIVIDKTTGKKRGFGYVTFDSVEAVEKSIMNKSHMIGGLRCDVKKALTRDEMGKSSNQYGRDRQERDARSRGTGRGDGYSFGGGYGHQGGYGSGGYSWNQSSQQTPGGGSWTATGYQSNGPATATYYPPSYGSGSAAPASGYSMTHSAYGSSGASYGQQPQYSSSGSAGYAPAGAYPSSNPSYGQPGSYPPNWNASGHAAAPAPNWTVQQQQPTGAAAPTWTPGAQPATGPAPSSWSQQGAYMTTQAPGWSQGSAPQARGGAAWSAQPAANVYRR